MLFSCCSHKCLTQVWHFSCLMLVDSLFLVKRTRCRFIFSSFFPMKIHIRDKLKTSSGWNAKHLHRSGGSGRSRSSITCKNSSLHPSKHREGKAGKSQWGKLMLKTDKEDKNIFQRADDKSSGTLQSQTSQAIFLQVRCEDEKIRFVVSRNNKRGLKKKQHRWVIICRRSKALARLSAADSNTFSPSLL